MKNRHYIKSIGIAAILLLAAFTVQAQQTLRTGYFLKGNSYRHRINPAMTCEQNYISLPLLGNTNINTNGNVGLAHFIYDAPNGTDLVTFMHPSVSADEFLGGLDKNNNITIGTDFTIMSAGFYAFGGYNTIDLGVRSQMGMNVPYDMFKFMKDMSGDSYSIGDMNITTSNYLDLSLGHSHRINSDLTVGARLKFLFGLAYADVMFDRMDISMSGSQWSINAHGTANVAMGGEFTLSDERMVNGRPAVDGYDNMTAGLNGFGLGLDLGVTYDLSNVLTEGLIVSASLNDIGFMNWKNVSQAAIDPDSPFTFDGFKNISIHDDVPGASIEDQFDDLGEDLEDFFALEDKGKGSLNKALSATLNVGVEYKMPFYNKLSAGVLYSSRFDDIYPLHQFSFMANVSPLSWFDFAVSATASNYGTGFGALANVHFTGFNLFLGTDCFVGKVNNQFIPLDNMNSSLSFGVNIPFGRKR